MILPTKFLREHDALIGVGAAILSHLSVEKTLSNLWEELKAQTNIGNFERFILGLDLLFLLGLIEAHEDRIVLTAL